MGVLVECGDAGNGDIVIGSYYADSSKLLFLVICSLL